MKKILSLALICMLLVGTLFVLASCSDDDASNTAATTAATTAAPKATDLFDGTYSLDMEVSEGVTVKTTYVFTKTGTLTTTATYMGVTESMTATYTLAEAADGSMTITVTYTEGGEEITETSTFERGADYLIIDGMRIEAAD